jgi:metallo-beta-lactamase family protein
MPVTIRFLGAAQTVTGSRFLLENDGRKILVDAGMFQGLKELRLRNWNPLPIDPQEIETILISHAHLDHCGYLPKLVEAGFNGKIHMTKYTSKLSQVVLRDSASLQVEDAKYAMKKGYSKHKEPKALYDLEDAEKTISFFVEHEFKKRIEVAPEVFVTFYHSGHILGSASLLVEFCGKSFYFSGDLGRPSHPILLPPEPIPMQEIDALIVESTYGDRQHPAKTSALPDAINNTIKRGGSILIPAFAIDRTEILLMAIKDLIDKKLIPNIPIFIDSPMALAALGEYEKAIRDKESEIKPEILALVTNPFDAGNISEAKTVDESKALNNPENPCIIISASGMATGGRVVHHLEWMLPDGRNSVLLVGYQAIGTRGQTLLSGAKELKMYGGMVPVRAEVIQIEEFSVHGDANELIAWLKLGGKPKQTYVIHGEKNSADAFAIKVKNELNWNVIVPKDDQVFKI